MTRPMSPSKLCGGDTGYGCGKAVPPEQGRRSGLTWWHPSALCQAEYRRARYARLRARQGMTSPLVTCTHCGRRYSRRQANPAVGPFCERLACARERARRYQLARTRALARLAAEHPERIAELFAEEAARVAPLEGAA